MHFSKFQSDSTVVLSLSCTQGGPGEYIIVVIRPHLGKSDAAGLELGSRHCWGLDAVEV